MYKSDTKIKVRYAETDQMAIVHHANYYVYFETAREQRIIPSGSLSLHRPDCRHTGQTPDKRFRKRNIRDPAVRQRKSYRRVRKRSWLLWQHHSPASRACC